MYECLFREISPEFKGNQQQDAHELLKCVLMNIDEASNELNTSRSKLKLCIGNRFRENNLQVLVQNLDSNAKKLQANVSMFQANNTAACNVDLKKNASILCDLKRELQEVEDMSFRVTERRNMLTSDVLRAEECSLYRDMKRQKYSQKTLSSDLRECICDGGDHILIDDGDDEEISFRVADNQFSGSQVSLICLNELLRGKQQQEILQNCHIQLHRLDSPLGMRHANFATGAISNLVTELFQGMMSLKTKCLNCLKETERKEEFQDISLPIRKPTAAVDRSNKSNADGDNKNKRGLYYDQTFCSQ